MQFSTTNKTILSHDSIQFAKVVVTPNQTLTITTLTLILTLTTIPM